MRLPLSWLSEWVDLPPADPLAERLLLCGFEDVAVTSLGPDLSGLRVGAVVRCERHPNADKLSVCAVDAGDGALRTIVCGAPNVAAGQKVAVALPGTSLPDGTRIEKAKLRGVVSEGMICSRRELGLGDDHQGIWVLDPGARVGASLAELVPGDAILEVGITPNRGDAASVLGMAREVRALFGGPLRRPETQPDERGARASDAVRVSIDAPDACWHYAARVVRGLRVGASPEPVRRRLEAAGLRSINNVVDATNLVLLEQGQPIHAFDLAKLRGRHVRVRRAAAGETLRTLDGELRRLDPEDLVIADAERPIALAGVMGGADTEVTEATAEVLIESAHFAPSAIRRAARRHGLHSEASYRFERGVDREGITRAADRTARLLAELAGGEVAAGRVEARGHAAPAHPPIELDVARMNRLLGTQIPTEEAARLLEGLEIRCSETASGVLRCEIPSWRNDLELPQDLTEEVARLYGYERIPTTLPIAALAPARLPAGQVLADRSRTLLAGLGLSELMTMPFVSRADLAQLRLDPADPRREGMRLLNPVQEQDSQLRTTLLPSLLRVARQNRSRQVDQLAVFEVCRVFVPRVGAPLPDEPLTIGALLTRGRDRHLWDPPEPPPLFFEVRGIAERLLNGLGYEACFRHGGSVSHLHPGAQAEIDVAGRRVGSLGELHPEVLRSFELDVPAAYAEVDLDALAAVPPRRAEFREPSREPAIRRDLAVLIAREQPAGELVEAIRKHGGADLVSVELFDRYEGRGVPEGRVSVAFRLVFQRADRTLVDAEVNDAMQRVVRALAQRFGAELR
jgi:phenylalanyl-tRNA synthetase beta chain